MKRCKGYRYRIYPTNNQIKKISSVLGCVRFVYNYFLDERIYAWKNNKENISYVKTSAMLTRLKQNKEYFWLNEADSMALQESLRDLDRAYRNFFEKRSHYPKHHSKRDLVQTYRTRNQKDGIRFEGNKLHIPVIGFVKIKKSRGFNGRILNATITRNATGKYFVSLSVEEEFTTKSNAGGMIGIDVGIKEFYTDSNGIEIHNPHIFTAYEKRLRREQRRLSRMVRTNIIGYTDGPKGGRIPVFAKSINECKNIQKQRRKVSLIYEKIYNSRNDFLHKVSTMLVSENQVIAIEDLNIQGMLKNHKLAKAISDVSWRKFFSMLEYKALDYGTDILKVPTTFPSSQICSCCGYKNPLLRDLKVREWNCPKCHTQHGRDSNAALNILKRALKTA